MSNTRNTAIFVLCLALVQSAWSELLPGGYTTDVFVGGREAYPAYRIPSLITSQKGTLLAFAEGRQSLSDHAENDIVLKRSADGGRTWQPLQVVASSGKDSLNNPQAVVLPDGGRILFVYQVFPHNYHARSIGTRIKRVKPGLSGEGVEKCYLTYSDDDGKSWSEPIDITAQVKRPDTIVSIAGGPGRGIVLQRGPHRNRVVMPFNESWYEGKQRKFNVYATYSDDNGKTWKRGKPAPHDQAKPGQNGFGNEVQMVELADGSILLNSRSSNANRYRKIARSLDGGQSWSELVDDKQLPEPQCMGSIIRYNLLDDGKSRILFSCPADQRSRRGGTIRLSFDEGKSWPVSRILEDDFFAYSCLTVLKSGRVGCLYEAEGCKRMRFACFDLHWLTTGTEASAAKSDEPKFFDVFVVGKEKVKGWRGQDYAQFREQNVIVTNSGRIVVICQGRNSSNWSDRSGQDLVCKWSLDNGRTWSDAVLVASHGEKSICPNAAVYEKQTDRIIVLYNLFEWPYTNAQSREDWPSPKTRQYMVYSDDEGATWSKPLNINSMMRQSGTTVVFGSGEGIQIRTGPWRGRLILPGGDFEGGKKLYTFYSDDQGRTWKYGKPVPKPEDFALQCENSIAELPDGTLLMNNRSNQSKYRRRAWSTDGGVTWSMIENDIQLPSVGCNGSIIAFSDPLDAERSRILYSGPTGPGRTGGTVFLSYDYGRTWPVHKVVVSEEFAYSSIVRLPDRKIGLFYEANGHKNIHLVRFGLDWLLKPNAK